ncbi:MAG: hypothetical protein CVU59_06750 [Deltaproteobacteria bacterium HGW-Deltaproteobacteria-17]|nr:MAG: hypothetical protein CVU59_06750 [Deltaproteobacteria bacterium HGW-Deltaproteobacteria-17]
MPGRLVQFAAILFSLACTRGAPPPDPWRPSPLTLLDPDARMALAARLEVEPWPTGAARTHAVKLLSDWIRWRGIRAPRPFFERLASELEPEARRRLWLEALESYPGRRPYPPREDPTAAWILKDLAGLDGADATRKPAMIGQVRALLARIVQPADPRHIVRSTVADLSADFPPRPEVAELFLHLLAPDVPGNVRARAMLSLGIAGFSDPRLLPPLLEGLIAVQDHVNLAPFALTALSGARGEARELVGTLVALTLETGRAPGAGTTAARGIPATMQDVMENMERSPVVRQDPSLLLRTFARVLVAMGDGGRIRRLAQTTYSLVGRDPGFIPDESFHAVREILLTGIPRGLPLTAEERAGILTGEELAARAIAVSRVPRTCHPDLLALLASQRHTATVRLTTMDWIAQVRDAALKAALSMPEVAPELTRLWNAQDTEEGQWRATAHLWMPLVQVPGESTPGTDHGPCLEADTFEGMSPDEWLRARIARSLWICAVADPERPLAPIGAPEKPSAAVADPAWSGSREAARAARAAACLEHRLKRLADWERRTLDGCADFECLWRRFVRDAATWPEDAVEKSLRVLTARLDPAAARGLPGRLSEVPRVLVIPMLEWFEPRLTREQRVEIRNSLRGEKCLQDEACLPILLHAVQLAARGAEGLPAEREVHPWR